MAAINFIGQEEMILSILQEVEEARSDDYVLFAEVINRFYPSVAGVPIHKALAEHRKIGLPSYESLTRVRRKLQNKYPEYASERTRQNRKLTEAEYIAYAHT